MLASAPSARLFVRRNHHPLTSTNESRPCSAHERDNRSLRHRFYWSKWCMLNRLSNLSRVKRKRIQPEQERLSQLIWSRDRPAGSITNMALRYHRLLLPSLGHVDLKPTRSLFYWLTIVWNRVDHERIKEVGPDRACAEWLLRNGASVRWKGISTFLADYNALPKNEKVSQHIQAVDATDSSISHIGFPHFSGCKYIDEIKLVKCLYIENSALGKLSVLKDTLKHLEVLDCGNITDEALKTLKNLTNLRVLKLQGMPYVKDKAGVEKELTQALPNCAIEWK